MQKNKQSKQPKKANKQTLRSGTSMAVGTVKGQPSIRYNELRSSFSSTRSAKDGSLLVKGMDYLGPSNGAATSTVTTLFNYSINPLTGLFTGTRLQNFALNFDKYVFKRLVFHVQTATPTSTGGSYVVGFDRDIDDPLPPASDAGVRTLMANQGARNAAICENVSINIPLADTQQFYYTNYSGADARLVYQGRLVGMNTTPITAAYSLCVWCEYEILFMDPSIETLDLNSVGTYKTYALTPAQVSYPATLVTPVKGDILSLVPANPPILANTAYKASPATPTPLGFNIATGLYMYETVMKLTNSGSGTSQAYAYLSAVANIASGISATVANSQNYTTAQSNVNIATSNTGDVGYSISSIAAGSNVTSVLRWIISIPPGGGVLTPILAQSASDASGVVVAVANNIYYSLQKISPSGFASLSY